MEGSIILVSLYYFLITTLQRTELYSPTDFNVIKYGGQWQQCCRYFLEPKDQPGVLRSTVSHLLSISALIYPTTPHCPAPTWKPKSILFHLHSPSNCLPISFWKHTVMKMNLMLARFYTSWKLGTSWIWSLAWFQSRSSWISLLLK